MGVDRKQEKFDSRVGGEDSILSTKSFGETTFSFDIWDDVGGECIALKSGLSVRLIRFTGKKV